MRHEPGCNPTQRLLGVLVCLCLALQPLLVPLHLGLEDHTHGHAAPPGEIASHGHPHGHAHHPDSLPHPHAPGDGLGADEGEDDDSHPPHPAEDHFCQQPDQLRAPSPGCETLATLPAVDLGAWGVAVSARLPERPRPAPQRPPPRAPDQPRAPPAIV